MALNLLGFNKILFVAKLTKLIDGYDKRVHWRNPANAYLGVYTDYVFSSDMLTSLKNNKRY